MLVFLLQFQNSSTCKMTFLCNANGSIKNHLISSDYKDTLRPLAHFPEGISDYFSESDVDYSQMEAYKAELESLKEQARAMLIDSSIDHKRKLNLINILDCLGVIYYFEKDVKDQLKCIFQGYDYENNYNLYATGVHFRVFRQHGYKMSCDVFNKFKDSDGKLQETLKSDVEGILSLYEAAHLAMHGEAFMDEVLHLTIGILRSVVFESNLENRSLYNQVVHATKQAYHTGIKRVETRHFISFYEEYESRDESLLRLAKIDFNMLQLFHRQELNQIVKWWNELNVRNELPYVRNRSLESHFWAIGLIYEACYSRARLFVAKVINILTVLDDTYDAYGTIDELALLTQAFESWDRDAIDELPTQMKKVFNYVCNLYDEIEKESKIEERDYASRYAKENVLEIIKIYYMEANWANKGYIPSYEECMSKAAATSSGTQTITTGFMLGMKNADAKEFDWVINPIPRVIRSVEVIGRVMNDIMSHEEEQNRGLHVASAVECCMLEQGSSKDEAIRFLQQMVKDAWKDINEDLVEPIHVSPHVFVLPINIARLFHVSYKEGNGYTYSAKIIKDDALLIYDKAFIV